MIALATASAAVVAAWAVIGFQGLASYPDQLSDNNAVYSSSTPLVQGLAQQLGGSQDLALIIGLLLAPAFCFSVRGVHVMTRSARLRSFSQPR